eukprot:5363408-Pyramimonas_sp.AAC.1
MRATRNTHPRWSRYTPGSNRTPRITCTTVTWYTTRARAMTRADARNQYRIVAGEVDEEDDHDDDRAMQRMRMNAHGRMMSKSGDGETHVCTNESAQQAAFFFRARASSSRADHLAAQTCQLGMSGIARCLGRVL